MLVQNGQVRFIHFLFLVFFWQPKCRRMLSLESVKAQTMTDKSSSNGEKLHLSNRIGAAAVFPSLDGGIGVIALAVFDFQPEYTGEVPQQFPHAGFSSIDIFQCVKSVQQFYQVHGAARPPQGRGIGRYVIFLFVLGGYAAPPCARPVSSFRCRCASFHDGWRGKR